MAVKIHFFLKKSIVIKLTFAEKQVNFKKKEEKKGFCILETTKEGNGERKNGN